MCIYIYIYIYIYIHTYIYKHTYTLSLSSGALARLLARVCASGRQLTRVQTTTPICFVLVCKYYIEIHYIIYLIYYSIQYITVM